MLLEDILGKSSIGDYVEKTLKVFSFTLHISLNRLTFEAGNSPIRLGWTVNEITH